MRVLSKVVGCVVVAGLVVSGAIAAALPAAAATANQLSLSKEYAPKGKRGAIILPYVYCPSGPAASASVRKVGSSKTVKVSWRTGLEYVYVSAGTYKVTIHRTCGDSPRGTATVKVRKEKDSNTVTEAEFARIKKGMTLAQVKRIVGTRGVGNSRYRYLDHRGSFGWAQLDLSGGRVAWKGWHAELGDNGVR